MLGWWKASKKIQILVCRVLRHIGRVLAEWNARLRVAPKPIGELLPKPLTVISNPRVEGCVAASDESFPETARLLCIPGAGEPAVSRCDGTAG